MIVSREYRLDFFLLLHRNCACYPQRVDFSSFGNSTIFHDLSEEGSFTTITLAFIDQSWDLRIIIIKPVLVLSWCESSDYFCNWVFEWLPLFFNGGRSGGTEVLDSSFLRMAMESWRRVESLRWSILKFFWEDQGQGFKQRFILHDRESIENRQKAYDQSPWSAQQSSALCMTFVMCMQ